MTDKDKEFEAALDSNNEESWTEDEQHLFKFGARWSRQYTLKEASEELGKAKAELAQLKAQKLRAREALALYEKSKEGK